MNRLGHAWRALEREQRLAALVSLGLFVSMLLPWYSKTDTFVEHNAAKSTQASLSAFQAFSFVEAAVLLVSAGVLTMLFARGEGRDFKLPGGDGTITMVAGGWAAALVFYRLLDKPGLSGNQRITATVGVQWGIFIALLLALGLLYAGARMRAAEGPEARGAPATETRRSARPDGRSRPPRGPQPAGENRGEGESRAEQEVTVITPAPARPGRSTPVPARGRPRYPPAPHEQLSLEDPKPGAE
jgi:hypothetical protein